MSTIKVKIIAMGMKNREITVKQNTALKEVIQSGVLTYFLRMDLENKTFLINGTIPLDDNPKLYDGDVIIVVETPHGPRILCLARDCEHNIQMFSDLPQGRCMNSITVDADRRCPRVGSPESWENEVEIRCEVSDCSHNTDGKCTEEMTDLDKKGYCKNYTSRDQ